MRRIFYMFIIAAALFACADAYAMPAISANGFTCSTTQASGGKSIIECSGQFPGVTGVFGATGYDIVHVEYSPDNKKRYFYMSEAGCLIMNAADGASLGIDRAGTKKQFSAFTDAMTWCYSGGREAASSSPAPAPAPSQTNPRTPPVTSGPSTTK